ncbi:hypothetical protein SEA_FRIBS8_30 [Gordonia phage Fribs8]|nr:hypothetical protein SEA_FRIBS8_30 [Gordonia phage Fribs8]
MTFFAITALDDPEDYADGIAPTALAFLETLGVKIGPRASDGLFGVDVESPAALQMAIQMANQVRDAADTDEDTCYHWLGLSGDDDLDYGGSYVLEALETTCEKLGVVFDPEYDSTDLHAKVRAWGMSQGFHML